MPSFRVNMKVDQRGPIFNAAVSRAAANRMIVNINDAIAEEGVQRVKAHLHAVLKNPTGYYESQITVDRRVIYRGVTDNNVVYGGWLEGNSSRNKTTRFKGYHTFRIVKQTLDKDSVQIAKPYVERYVREMNE